MPIFEQNYRDWDGTLKTSRFRWLPIATVGIKQTFKKRKFLLFFLTCLIPFVVYAAILVFYALKPKGFEVLDKFFKFGPAYFATFLNVQNWFVYIVAIWVGSNLINEDYKSNALQLYLSKPLTPRDYIFGKISILAFFILTISAIPALLLFILRLLMMYDTEWLTSYYWLPFSILSYNLLLIFFISTFILFFSSVTKNSRFSGIGFIFTLIFSSTIAMAFYGITKAKIFLHLSFGYCLQSSISIFLGNEANVMHDDFSGSLNPWISTGYLILVSLFFYWIIKRKVHKTEVIS